MDAMEEMKRTNYSGSSASGSLEGVLGNANLRDVNVVV